MTKPKRSGGSLNPGLKGDLEEAYAFMNGKTKVLKRFTTETYRIVDPGIVKAARAQLHLSQPRFAEFVNTSPSTVRAWEQGTRRPDGVASVLLELIRENPAKMRALLEEHRERITKLSQASRKKKALALA
jgi:DNA-binding transcriptional regulator YiaG